MIWGKIEDNGDIIEVHGVGFDGLQAPKMIWIWEILEPRFV